MKEIYVTIFPWTLTNLQLAATDKGVCCINFSKSSNLDSFIQKIENKYSIPVKENDSAFSEISEKLIRYFAGQKVSFKGDVDLLQGTDFQKKVWEQVSRIEYGQFKTYKQIAIDLNNPKAIRAVGTANGANPVPILIPCHRVISSDGGLGGYSGGLDVKDALLRLEGAVI